MTTDNMSPKVKDVLHPLIYDDVSTVSNSDIEWDKLKGKTILITGAAGFIGFYLTVGILIKNDLDKLGTKVVALVRNEEKAKKRFGKLLERDDLTLVVQNVCADINIAEKADYIIHAASQASNYAFEHDPVGTIDANVAGTDKVLRYALESDSTAVLFISSLKVYGAVRNGKDRIEEGDIGYLDQVSYKNCYAQGKRMAETICAAYNQQYGLNVKIARPAYIYGPSDLDDNRVWAQFISNIVKKEDILLKSSGAPLRSFCYVTDTATALLGILISGREVYPYNISAEHSNVTIRNFARAAVELFPELNLKLRFENPEDEKEPARRSPLDSTPEILDSSRLEKLGIIPKVSLSEGIRRSVQIVALQTN